MKYGINDKPPAVPMFLYSLQWWVVSLPCVIIMGLVIARLQFGADHGAQIFYLQKLFAVVALTVVLQLLAGHRLPLVTGPAAILLVAMTSSTSSSMAAMQSSIILGGLAVTIIGASGLLGKMRSFFTPRVVAVIVILIAFTMMPTIIRLTLSGPSDKHNALFAFALGLTFFMLVLNKFLKGSAKSMTVLFGIIVGTAVYFFAIEMPDFNYPVAGNATYYFFIEKFEFDAGTTISFLICFLALTVNELGSIESLAHILKADNMSSRIKRGMTVTGLSNIAAGGMGIIGPVDYVLSAGVISATGCASRYPLLIGGLALGLCSISSSMIFYLSHIPGAVMSALMLYLMSTQMGSGISILVQDKSVSNVDEGLIVALPLMVAVMAAFSPASVFDQFPQVLRPLVQNGFVMGTLTVLILEHVLLKNTPKK